MAFSSIVGATLAVALEPCGLAVAFAAAYGLAVALEPCGLAVALVAACGLAVALAAV